MTDVEVLSTKARLDYHESRAGRKSEEANASSALRVASRYGELQKQKGNCKNKNPGLGRDAHIPYMGKHYDASPPPPTPTLLTPPIGNRSDKGRVNIEPQNCDETAMSPAPPGDG